MFQCGECCAANADVTDVVKVSFPVVPTEEEVIKKTLPQEAAVVKQGVEEQAEAEAEAATQGDSAQKAAVEAAAMRKAAEERERQEQEREQLQREVAARLELEAQKRAQAEKTEQEQAQKSSDAEKAEVARREQAEKLQREQQRKAAVASFLKQYAFKGVNAPKRSCCCFTTYPLHTAAKLGDREMVEFLLAEGADNVLRDSSGRTALEVARTRERRSGRHHSVVLALEDHH